MLDSQKKQTRWTIMLYIAADGDLANFAVESLKQVNHSASIPSDQGDQAKVVVAAQFAVDAPGVQPIPRYIFDEQSGGPLSGSVASYLQPSDNMTEQQALISFLKWVYDEKNDRCKADRYLLMLWGHGPELLMQPPSVQQLDVSGSDSQNASTHLYLSPVELRIAIEAGKPKDKALNIIGFDACSMSMFEVAYELRGLADYMVASQEEVPDLSFPYDTLVDLFRKMGDEPESLLQSGVSAHVQAYQDCICNAVTGMKPATASALRINACDGLKSALQRLAGALLEAKDDPSLPGLLIEARKKSRDFASGLYVDLVDFSTKLVSQLSVSQSARGPSSSSSSAEEGNRLSRQLASKSEIQAACEDIIKALAEGPLGNPGKSLVLANRSADTRCNGVSLYFPYLGDQQHAEINQPKVKGGIGSRGAKEFSSVLNNAGAGLLMSARRELIGDTESYYGDLKLAVDTGWYRFIVEQWSSILAELAPKDLDLRYSAQQCAINLRLRNGTQKDCADQKKPPVTGKEAPFDISKAG
jgi:Clostripain family